MKVAVTGATGFLGSHLCRCLVLDGHRVVALRRPTSGDGELGRLRVETVLGDVTDPTAVRALVRECDAIFHAAASIRYGQEMSGEHQRVNVHGTRVVAEACRRVASARLIHVSSVAAIGVPEGRRPAAEDFAFNADGLSYHRSKADAEAAVLEEVGRGLDAVIVNPASILGPWHRSYRGSEVPMAVSRRRIVPYFVGGTTVAHVADVVDGILAALEHGRRGERYILGGENLSWRRMAEMAAEELGVRRVFAPLPPPLPAALARARGVAARFGRPASFSSDSVQLVSRYQYYDSSRARTELGYSPRGYREIVRDYLGGPWRAPSGRD
jgi:dihydroflavonol-4-reductase